jgi:hypothetical protein
MRRKITAIALAGGFALAAPAAALAQGNPHAGQSGKFKGSATPCGQAQPCPPHGG